MKAELENEIANIARREAYELLSRYGLEARQHMVNAIMPAVEAETARQVAAQIPPTPVLEIHIGRRKRPNKIRQPYHHRLPDLIKMAGSQTLNGFAPPIWLYGPPGSGKNVLAEQIAKAMEVPFYLVALGPTSTETKLLGYTNLVNGQYIPGLLCEPFRNGGLAYLDEIDAADPGVLVGINALVSNDHYRFADGEIVARHPDFYIVAGANTIGGGGTSGFTRHKLDAAFLDRFIKIKIDYDPKLESALCENKKWVAYVQRARSYIQEKL